MYVLCNEDEFFGGGFLSILSVCLEAKVVSFQSQGFGEVEFWLGVWCFAMKTSFMCHREVFTEFYKLPLSDDCF